MTASYGVFFECEATETYYQAYLLSDLAAVLSISARIVWNIRLDDEFVAYERCVVTYCVEPVVRWSCSVDAGLQSVRCDSSADFDRLASGPSGVG